MAEIVNLRMARKARKREDAQAQAAANRARHGEARSETVKRRLDAERDARNLEGARRDKD